MSLSDLVAHTRGLYTTLDGGGGEGLGAELLAQPYQVNGLSQQVPNERYGLLNARRLQLEQRLAKVRAQHERLCGAARDMPPCSLDEPSAVADALERQRQVLREQLLAQRGPPLPLLKPLGEAQALNAYWRDLLGSQIAATLADYTDSTRAALEARLLAGEAGAIAQAAARVIAPANTAALVTRIVEPVLQSYVTELRTSTYEDMPHTQELLKRYLFTFLDLILETQRRRLAAEAAAAAEADGDDDDNDAAALAPPESAPVSEWQIQLVGRGYHFSLDRAAARLLTAAAIPSDQSGGGGGGNSNVDEIDQAVLEAAYLQETLLQHASAELFGDWLGEWRRDADRFADLPSAESRQDVSRLAQRIVERLIQSGLEQQKQRSQACEGDVGPPSYEYVAPTEAEIRDAYSALLRADVAHARARIVVDAGDELYGVFSHALANAARLADAASAGTRASLDQLVPPHLLVVQRHDRFVILAAQRSQLARSATAADLAKIDARAAALRSLFLEYAPEGAGAGAGAGGGGGGGGGAPPLDTMNLASTVDTTVAARSLPALFTSVRRDGERFAAQAVHERANALRELVSYVYAERLLQREATRLAYALEQIASPTRPAPLVVEIDVGDLGATLELSANIALRDELEHGRLLWSRSGNGNRNNAELLKRINAAEQALSNARSISVRWLHRALDSVGERVLPSIDTTPLPRGQLTSTLRLVAGGAAAAADPTTRSLGGWYRAEFTVQLERAAGQLVDPAPLLVQSVFVARVRIMATCVRDAQRFEVGDPSAMCEWSGERVLLSEREQRQRKGAYEVLMGRDPELVRLDELAAAAIEPGSLGARAGLLYEPPWYGESDVELLRAVEHYSGACGRTAELEFRARFAYKHIVDSIVRRLARGVRQVAAAGVPRPSLVDRELGELVDVASDRRAFLLLVSLGRNPLARGSELGRQIADAAARGRFVIESGHERLEEGVVQVSDRYNSDEPERQFQSPALRSVTLLGDLNELSGGVEQVPIASMVLALLVPRVWRNLALAEQRFVSHLFERLEQIGHLVTNEASATAAATSWTQWAPLAHLLPSDVPPQERAGLLLDEASVLQFQQRVAQLKKRCLVAANNVTGFDSVSGYRHARTTFRSAVPTLGYSGGGFESACDSVQAANWLGEHSYESGAPQLYRVDLRSGKIEQHGSLPLRSLAYDFEALRAEIGSMARLIAELVGGGGAAPAQVPRIEQLRLRLGARVLLYNSLVQFVPVSSLEQRSQRSADIAELYTNESVLRYFRTLLGGDGGSVGVSA